MAKTELFARWMNGGIQPLYSETQSAGTIFFVQDTLGVDAVGYGDNPERPFSTLAYAYAATTTLLGDLIILMPGHDETVDTDAWLVMNKANVTIRGVGNGALMPSFTFDGAGADTAVSWDITGADNTLKNIWFNNTEDGCLAPLDVSGAGLTIDGCYFNDAGADNTIVWIDLAATANDCTIKDCRNYGTDTAGNDAWVSVSGACSGLHITECWSNGDFAAGNVEFLAAATDLEIDNCLFENLNAVNVNIEGFAGCTGWIHDCGFKLITDGLLTWVNTLGNLSIWECYGTNNLGETGLLIVNGVVTPLCTVP